MSTEKPNYYAIIPANVRYDNTLRPNAKLLYAEITALANAQGFCNARNGYFAELYGLSKKTIEGLIAQLVKQQYIRVKVNRDAQGEVIDRQIWVIPLPEEVDTPPLNFKETSPKNEGETPLKNKGYLNRMNITRKNNTPIVPKSKLDQWAEYAGEDAELLGALRDFEQMRNRRKKPMTERARRMLLNALDKLSNGDRETKIKMLELSIVHCWDTVYPLKANDREKPEKTKKKGRADEWLE